MKLILKDKTELTIDALNFPADIVKTYASKDAFVNTWNLLTENNLSEMEVYEDDVKTVKMEGYLLDSMQAVVNSDGSITGHFYLRDGQYASVVIDAEEEAKKKEIIDKVNDFGGFHTEIVQSDKIGFDWKEEYIGTILLTRIYVEQETPVGTPENPIEYYDGVQLIDNAYYNKDGKRFVYMNAEWIEY